jgi:uncharacterized protein (UPF0332 family)
MNESTDLAYYRLDRARETLKEAELLLDGDHLNGAINRLYYAAFYAVRALLATKGKDSVKHSGVISLFNKEFVKTGIVDKKHGKTLTQAFRLRSEGDYQDFRNFHNDVVKTLFSDVTALIAIIEEKMKSGHGS